MRATALAFALLLAAGCVTSPPPASPGNTTSPAPAAGNAGGNATAPAPVATKLDQCPGAATLLKSATFIVPAMLSGSLSADVPTCGKGEAILNGTMTGNVAVSWTGGAGGCPQAQVVTPAELLCWEEGLPAGRVQVSYNMTGGGTVDLHVYDYR